MWDYSIPKEEESNGLT